jgi:hypothetical protein
MKAKVLLRSVVVAWVTLAARAVCEPAEMPVTIIANPGPFASIEQAAVAEDRANFWDGDHSDDDACTECFAAAELRRFLAACLRITDINLIALQPPGDQLPESGYVFVLGSRESNRLIPTLAERADGKRALKTDESYRIRAYPDRQRTICVIEGRGRVGTLYGVHDYLTRLGMRFYGLGEPGTVYPTAQARLITRLDVTENPAFHIRGFFAWHDRGNEDFFLWMARNRMSLWTAVEKEIPFLKKLGFQLAIGAHDVQTNFLNPSGEYPFNSPLISDDESKPAAAYAASPESQGDTDGDGKLTYFEAHPEWYGWRNGKRIDDVSGWGERRCNYCTSNDDATTDLARNFTQGLIDGIWRRADLINFWMVDGDKLWCQCDKCKGIGYTDRLLAILYKVNQHVQKARADGRLARRVHLNSLAYHETVEPPTQPLPADFDYENCSMTFYPIGRCYAHEIDDPRCREFNTRYADQIRRWAGREHYKGGLWIGEYYNLSVYVTLPILYTRTMPHDVQWYQRQTAMGLHYMHTPTTDWGTWTLNQYLLASLLWNPALDADALLKDYFRRFYPTTTRHTRRFYNHLEDAYSNITAFKYGLPTHLVKLKPDQDLFGQEHLRWKPASSSATNNAPPLVEMVDSMRQARQSLDQALTHCKGATERARLLADEARFYYGEAMLLFSYHIVRTLALELEGNPTAAREEFASVEREAQRLAAVGANLTESYIGAPKNGLPASGGMFNLYGQLKKKYGVPPAPPAPAVR